MQIFNSITNILVGVLCIIMGLWLDCNPDWLRVTSVILGALITVFALLEVISR